MGHDIIHLHWVIAYKQFTVKSLACPHISRQPPQCFIISPAGLPSIWEILLGLRGECYKSELGSELGSGCRGGVSELRSGCRGGVSELGSEHLNLA